jgi:hypothetical protein
MASRATTAFLKLNNALSGRSLGLYAVKKHKKVTRKHIVLHLFEIRKDSVG